MVKEILGTVGGLFKNVIVSICIGVFIEVGISVAYVFYTGHDGLDILQTGFNNNQIHIPDFLNYWFEYIYQLLNRLDIGLAHYIKTDIVNALYLSAMIYLQKVSIVIISLYVYFFILVVFVIDGIVARDIRRHRAGVESVRRKEFESYSTWIEYAMFIIYLSLPIYIPASIWFIGIGFFAAIFHRMRYQYIQKYL